MFDWNKFNEQIGCRIAIDGKRIYDDLGPTVSGITLVEFFENDENFETFYEFLNDDKIITKGIELPVVAFNHAATSNALSKNQNETISKIWNEKFPAGSVLAYGRIAALILKPSKNEEQIFGVYDMKNHKFVDHENIKMKSLLANGNPLNNYNREALFTICDDPARLVTFFEENGVPKTEEGKLMFFDLANRVANLYRDNTLDEISSKLYADKNSKQK